VAETNSHRAKEVEAVQRIADLARAELGAIGLPQEWIEPLGSPSAHELAEAERYGEDPEQIAAYRAWRREMGLDSPSSSSGPAAREAARRSAGRELERLRDRIDQKKRNAKHAPTATHRIRAQQNIEALEERAEQLEEQIEDHPELTNDRFCRNPDCAAPLPRPREWPDVWCASCLNQP
jgi:hypothetical protein